MNEYLNSWYILAETGTGRHVIMMHCGNELDCSPAVHSLCTVHAMQLSWRFSSVQFSSVQFSSVQFSCSVHAL